MNYLSDCYKNIVNILKINKIDSPETEAKLIIQLVTNLKNNDFILLKYKIVIDDIITNKIDNIVKKRINSKNIQSLLGNWEFYGYRFIVNKDVLIPREETELLIDIAINDIAINNLNNDKKEYKVLEVGVGSGIISITLAKNIKNIKIDAIDISKKALYIAKKNIFLHKLEDKIDLINVDLFDFIPKKRYDLIISNPPYIKKQDTISLIKEKKLHDPFIALSGGNDGLDFYRKFEEFAKDFLEDGGKLIFEHGMGQRGAIKKIFKDYNIKVYDDLNGIDRAFLVS